MSRSRDTLYTLGVTKAKNNEKTFDKNQSCPFNTQIKTDIITSKYYATFNNK